MLYFRLYLNALPGGKIFDQRPSHTVRNSFTPQPSVHADVQFNRPLKFSRYAIQSRADRRIHHRKNALSDNIFEVLLVKRPHQQHRLLDASLAQTNRFVELHHGKSCHLRHRLKNVGDIRGSQAVAIVLDDRQNRSRAGPATDLPHIVPQVLGMYLHPRIK
jgi:hypothetical protein